MADRLELLITGVEQIDMINAKLSFGFAKRKVFCSRGSVTTCWNKFVGKDFAGNDSPGLVRGYFRREDTGGRGAPPGLGLCPDPGSL